MRLGKFIIESEDFDDILAKIEVNCKPIIKDIKKAIALGDLQKKFPFLYRGGMPRSKGFIEITPRKDRRPLDSPVEWHDALNKEFEKKFGVKARSQTVFTKGFTPTGYGVDYVVLPIGKYYVLWSNSIDDLYEYYKKKKKQKDNINIELEVEKVVSTYKKSSIIEVKSAFSREKLRSHEIMLFCDRYYSVSIYDPENKDLLYSIVKEFFPSVLNHCKGIINK